MNVASQPVYQSPAQRIPAYPKSAHPSPAHQGAEATVTAFGHVQPSRYSDEQVQSVLFERWDCHDDSRKVWKTFPVAEARQFRKGQTVLLRTVRQGKRQGWQIEPLGTPPYPPKSDYQQPEPKSSTATATAPGALYSLPEPSRPPNPPLSPGQKQALAQWIAQQADLYAFCFGEAQRALAPREPEEETVRACASSLFISAMRKFRLEQ